MGMASKQLFVRVANTPEVSQSIGGCVQQVARICGVAHEDDGRFWTLSGFADTKQQLAVACLLHWKLKQLKESGAVVFVTTSSMSSCSSLAGLLNCNEAALEPPDTDVMKVLNAQEFVQLLSKEKEDIKHKVQIVDCRESKQFLGLVSDSEVSGHIDGAVNVPFATIFTSSSGAGDRTKGDKMPTHDLNDERATLLSVDEFRDMFEVSGIDLNRPVALVSSKPAEGAAVATALLFAGQHAEIAFCTELLSDDFIASIHSSYTTGIFSKGQLLYKDNKGEFDLSPQSHEFIFTDDVKATRKVLEKTYNEKISGKASKKKGISTEEVSNNDEIVWIKEGHRFFDMPLPISKDEFMDVSRTIFRVVSFVLAPFGFPASLRKKRSLQEVKTQCGSLFQDVLEVCSDLIYQEKKLNEGAMAMSVHKWVEEKHDRDCIARIKAINELWDILYTPPAVVEVPDLNEGHVLALATKLEQKMHKLVGQRTPWAFEHEYDEKETSDDESDIDSHEIIIDVEKDTLNEKERDEMDTMENKVNFEEKEMTTEAETANEKREFADEKKVSVEETDKKMNVTLDNADMDEATPDMTKETSKINASVSRNRPKKVDKVEDSWKCMYRSVVYVLGFIPKDANARHKKLSTLQIKSFIQAVAEASWDVFKNETSELSQIEFQALCETLQGEKREQLVDRVAKTKRTLYVLKHFLTRSLLKTDEILADKLVCVREAVLDGDVRRRSGCNQVALAAYSKAFEYLPLYHKDLENAIVGRARCFLDMNEPGRAKTEALIALKLNPYSVGGYECLGRVEDKNEHPEAAMQHYVSSFILDGSRSAEVADSIDRASRLVGRRVAKALFAKIEKLHELPSAWLVESYFESFEHDADYTARLPFDIAKKEKVEQIHLDALALLHRAIYLKRTKKYGAAQRDICTLVSKDMQSEGLMVEDRALALNLHASLLYVAGDVHTAIKAINKSLELQPTCVNSLVKKGGFLAEIGEKDNAILCFSKAIELDSNEADVHLHLGQTELLDGNYNKAVQCLRRCISRSNALPMTHVVYGMALYKCGSTYQAKDVFNEASKKFPESAEVHLFHGEVLADQGNYADAMRHFLTAWELSPQCPLPFLNAGRVYVGTNDPMRAIAHFKQALEVDPRCSSAHLDIAQVLFAQGRTSEAFEHFKVAASCCRFLPEVEEVCACQEMAKMQLKVTEILGVELRHIMRSKSHTLRITVVEHMAGGKHQAFTYATIVAFAGGAGYILKRHTPSLVGGMVLSVGFLGAGLLVLTDTITDHHFDHFTSLTMSGIVASVMARRAMITRMRAPSIVATAAAMSAGYHMQQLNNPPRKMRYVPGAPPVPSNGDE